MVYGIHNILEDRQQLQILQESQPTGLGRGRLGILCHRLLLSSTSGWA